MRVILMAGGPGERWGNYMGAPKHLIPVPYDPGMQDWSEMLVHRTVRQLKERGVTDIHMVGPLEADDSPAYHIPGVEFHHTNRRFTASIYELWDVDAEGYGYAHPFGLTLVIFGDVYFTAEAMDKILGPMDYPNGYMWYGREGKDISQGEIWCKGIAPEAYDKYKAVMKELKDSVPIRAHKRTSGWEIYRKLHDIPISRHVITGDWVNIDDLTEDFDTPAEYEDWLRRMRESLHSK